MRNHQFSATAIMVTFTFFCACGDSDRIEGFETMSPRSDDVFIHEPDVQVQGGTTTPGNENTDSQHDQEESVDQTESTVEANTMDSPPSNESEEFIQADPIDDESVEHQSNTTPSEIGETCVRTSQCLENLSCEAVINENMVNENVCLEPAFNSDFFVLSLDSTDQLITNTNDPWVVCLRIATDAPHPDTGEAHCVGTGPVQCLSLSENTNHPSIASGQTFSKEELAQMEISVAFESQIDGLIQANNNNYLTTNPDDVKNWGCGFNIAPTHQYPAGTYQTMTQPGVNFGALDNTDFAITLRISGPVY